MVVAFISLVCPASAQQFATPAPLSFPEQATALPLGIGSDPPLAVADAYATTENTPLAVAAPGLLANDFDPDGEALRLLSAGPLVNGRFTSLVTNGQFTYEPDPGFVGTETFTYTMEDASGNQAVGNVTIEVLPDPNRAPIALPDAYATPADTPLAVEAPGLLANDYDADGEALRLLSAGPLLNGRFTSLVTNGQFTYEPDPGFVGTETFTYIMEDASGNQAVGNVTIEVVLSNQAPVAQAGADFTVVAGQLVTLDGSASFDPDLDALTYQWMFVNPGAADPIPPGSGAILSGAATAFPSFCADLPGQYFVELIVNDGYTDSVPDYVTVTVLSVTASLDILIEDIEGLETDGILNAGQTRALTRKIEQAQRLLDKGKTDEALYVLAGFRQQVLDLWQIDGVLTESDAMALVSLADIIISSVASPC